MSLKNSLKTFGLSQERGAASIGVFEEFGVASENMLNSFTYLTADNIEEIDEYIVGVVHPQGYILNKKFGKPPGKGDNICYITYYTCTAYLRSYVLLLDNRLLLFS